MIKAFCPRCNSFSLKEIADGVYKCMACGYEGILGIDKEFTKKY